MTKSPNMAPRLAEVGIPWPWVVNIDHLVDAQGEKQQVDRILIVAHAHAVVMGHLGEQWPIGIDFGHRILELLPRLA
jgi:hypothetical protein